MYYQEDQYLGSFLCRANFTAAEKEHDSYAEGKVELLQYTGLKDKSGREIYEGDIRVLDSRTWLVDWSSATGGFWLDSIRIGDFRNSLRELHGAKVIGNNYENPELLEAEE